jgi:hypothetical protein
LKVIIKFCWFCFNPHIGRCWNTKQYDMKAFVACLISFPETSSPIYFPPPLPVNPSFLLNISDAFTTNPHPLARSVPWTSWMDGSPNKHNVSMLQTVPTAVWRQNCFCLDTYILNEAFPTALLTQRQMEGQFCTSGRKEAILRYCSTLHQNLHRTAEIHKTCQNLAPGRNRKPEPAEDTTRLPTLYQDIRWQYCSEQGLKLQRAPYYTLVAPHSRWNLNLLACVLLEWHLTL